MKKSRFTNEQIDCGESAQQEKTAVFRPINTAVSSSNC